ncbi:uncharacterized protein BDZ99DRAFT_494016 [Mytilinidion resinicola]|uniref:Uncharacterized protein n=1 Tax=Mytilinidion resinicola TaxID=574789 RepID=A0A6A6Z4Y4_9PEZI|nr:uncharacterized protein BDZ99DRAFT_494016 [Mytilinidion resinicola]KAF2816136.1 hypothetical protein BDZ99DRAFT_494016 [Mytilinidion resinicola]
MAKGSRLSSSPSPRLVVAPPPFSSARAAFGGDTSGTATNPTRTMAPYPISKSAITPHMASLFAQTSGVTGIRTRITLVTAQSMNDVRDEVLKQGNGVDKWQNDIDEMWTILRTKDWEKDHDPGKDYNGGLDKRMKKLSRKLKAREEQERRGRERDG